MANGDSSGIFSPAKIIFSCIGVSIGIVTIGLTLVSSRMDDQGIEIAELRQELKERTDERYRLSDATRDFRLVEYRFERNEKNIDKCIDFIENHKNSTGMVMAND